VANALQERYAEVLLEKIRGDNYPSGTQMDMLEAVASPQVLLEHVLHLLDRMQAEPHPSIPMMQRIERLIAEFGS
jgi:hypothetical protein